MPLWLQAGFWGLVAGGALVIGALIGYFASVPQRVVAGIMAFGSGVLISALSFDLMEEAYERGGFTATGIGFIGGALIFTLPIGCWRGRARNIANAQASSSPRKTITMAAAWLSLSARSLMVCRNLL